MNLKALQSVISNVHIVAQQNANVAINQSLTMRNWLIGYYLVEYEQNGSDRQKYGSKVLQLIAEHAIKKNMKGLSQTTLKLCRQFFMHYPSIGQLATDQFKDHAIVLIGKTSTKQLKPSTTKTKISISQLTTDQFKNDDSEIFVEPEILINKLSFTHFVELIRVQNSLQKTFYELQSIKENWSVQDLKRAINTNLYARTGLSKNKTSIIKKLKKDLPLTPEELIKNPYSLEFLGLSEKKEFTENDLESAIINHLQQFISEMGKGFCFEARQKRITIGNKHYYIDLVFYHRILKCHVLIDLKMDAQMHEAAGQINYYLNYYNKNERQKSDNPPIGIILSANEDDAEVEYALGNLNNKIFITKYKIALPSERVLKNFIKKDLQKFYQAFRK